MTNPLSGLLDAGPPAPKWRLRDGTITSATPLMVRIDGDTDPTQPTKAPLVGGLSATQRVCCLLADKQLIILGRYGG